MVRRVSPWSAFWRSKEERVRSKLCRFRQTAPAVIAPTKRFGKLNRQPTPGGTMRAIDNTLWKCAHDADTPVSMVVDALLEALACLPNSARVGVDRLRLQPFGRSLPILLDVAIASGQLTHWNVGLWPSTADCTGWRPSCSVRFSDQPRAPCPC